MPRPSKYHQEWSDKLVLIEGWARDGLSDEQIAHNMQIGLSTLYDWKKKFSEFSESLKRSKEFVDLEVENALLKRALGYNYTETTSERRAMYNDDKEVIGYEMVVTKKVSKEVQPDVTAQIFWLKNRKPKQWRDTKVLQGDEEQPLAMPKVQLIIETYKKEESNSDNTNSSC